MTCLLMNPPVLPAQSRKAQAWLAGCEQGVARDCHELAKGYRTAKEGLQPDRPKAVRYYVKACELGLAAACQELGEGLVLEGRESLGSDSVMALEVLGRGCELEPDGKAGRTAGLVGGRGRCQGAVSLYQQMHPRTRPDSVTAKRVLRTACQRAQDKAACIMLSAGWASFPDSVALPDSVKRILAEAEARETARRDADRLRDSARVADSVAQAEAERARQEAARVKDAKKGEGRTSTRQAALRRTLRAACDADDAKACADLALMLERGQGGPSDRTQAASLRQKACSIDSAFCRKP